VGAGSPLADSYLIKIRQPLCFVGQQANPPEVRGREGCDCGWKGWSRSWQDAKGLSTSTHKGFHCL